ncbi:hypothetical protein DAEQUDRAFT_506574 [Daedalea quercina L-15889]|uniref:Alcohol acetyltransferase n=1 Tax=Daedalea quercina L-15889 TaxID=1314783 RepID=A0A165T922_9APHY|nr:hypothetical protein DAEQUDRAFT_506574 [Daedalea quercina L-15889]
MAQSELVNAKSIIREAGMFERWHIVRHKIGVLGAVVVSGRYMRADGSTFDKALLYAALEKVIQKHGFLSVHIVGEATPAPAFARLDTVNLDEVVIFTKDELREVLEAEAVKKFDASRPLWRVLVLRDGTVVFSFHHAIADGQSGLAFHQTLLEAINSLDQVSIPPAAVVSAPSEVTLLPPIEKAADLGVSPFTILRYIVKMLVPASWTSGYWAWTGYPCPQEAKLTTRMRLMYHTPEAAHRILQVCRAHNTSLTPLIHTLANVIISEHLAEDPSTAGKFSCIATNIPVSLRLLVNAPREAMCNYVSTLAWHPRLIKRSPSTDKSWLREFPWETASELTKTLKRQQTESLAPLGMLKFVKSYEDFLKSKLGKKREGTFEISNVGRFAARASKTEGGPASSQWVLDNVYFTQSNPSTSSAIHMNVAGDPAGGIGVCVAWSEGAIDDSFGEAFFAALKEGLEEVIHHDVV